MKAMSESSKAYIYPFVNEHNKYSYLQQDAIMECGYNPVSLKSIVKDFPTLILKRQHKSICVLNWLESRIVTENGYISIRGVILFFLYLSLLVCSRTKIYWVRHNYAPHNAKGLSIRLSRLTIKILEVLSIKIVNHTNSSPTKKDTYIPHPLYKNSPPKRVKFNSPPKFICLGNIKPYKGLSELLELWPVDFHLKIYGGLSDSAYGEKLKEIALRKKLNVDFQFKFISDEEVDVVLNDCDVMVLPHKSGSALVSGSYYLAKSFGMSVLMRGSSFKLSGDDRAVFDFSNRSLNIVLKDIENTLLMESKIKVYNEAILNYGDAVVYEYWRNLLA